jgi:hypothetical protein
MEEEKQKLKLKNGAKSEGRYVRKGKTIKEY